MLERGWQAFKDRGVVAHRHQHPGQGRGPRESSSTEFGHSFPNAPDPTGRVSVDYGVYGVPETFFIDRAGNVRYKHVGALTDAILKEQVEKLLGERS